MKATLKAGLRRLETLTVDPDRCVQFLGEQAQVYSTPDMVSDVEYACLRLIDEHLEDGESSVGVRVQLDHLAPTPPGAIVEVAVCIERIEGAKIFCSAELRDRIHLIGRGQHVRQVINCQRHARRLADKQRKLQAI